jgi:predicted dehydrogenase
LCEKPPAITPEEAALMEDTSKKTGRILAYGFHYRYSPEVQTLKRFIQEDELEKSMQVQLKLSVAGGFRAGEYLLIKSFREAVPLLI